MSINSSKYASGFSPQNIPGLTVWLDAADSNAVTQSGGAVSYWRDKSPNSLDMSQNTVAARPTYESNVQNGRPAIRFTTTQNIQTTSNVTLPPDQTWFMSFNVIASNSFFFFEHGTPIQTVQGSYLLSANNGLFGVNRGSPIRTIYDASAGSAGQNTIISFNTWYIASLVNSNLSGVASNDIYWSINGAARATDFYSGANTVYSAGATATNKLYLNFRSGGSNYIGELLIYNRALTRAEVRLTERYLAQKWGVTLPTAHPYFTIPATMRQFNPLDISGCSLWLDAGDYSTLTLSGTTITRWNDKSGNGRDASGNTGPTYSNNSVQFNGTQGLQTSLISSNVESGFVVASFTNVTNANSMLCGPTFGGRQFRVQGGTIQTNRQGVANVLTTGTALSNNTQYLLGYTNNATTLTHFSNGATYASGTAQAYNTTITTNIGGPVEGMVGTLWEVIMYEYALSTVQRQQVELYLAEKWNSRSSLSTSNTLRLYESLSPVFHPALISNCVLWLDVADPATLTLSGTNITGIVEKSGTVSSVSVSTARPTLNSSFKNGLAGATFTGSQWFRGTFPSTYGGSNLAMFTVATVNSSTSLNGRLLSLSTTGAFDTTSTKVNILRPGGAQGVAAYRAGFLSTASVSGYDTPFIMANVFDGASATIHINGTQAASNASSGVFSINNFGVAYLADYGGTADTAYWIGSVAEVIYYLGPITVQQRQQIEGYLAWKWGFVGNLPSTHPYKKTPV